MKFSRLWLEVPTLSQGNPTREAQGLSNDWCGRTSSCMVHNYVQQVAGDPGAFIVNNSSDASLPYDLVYPDGRVAADGYMLGEPLEAGCGGWGAQQYLYPEDQRGAPVTAAKAEELLGPVFDSLERSLPVVAYTGISLRSAPTHIVVISGYERRPDGSVWLLIDDPSVLDDDKESRIGSENLTLEGSAPELSRGSWGRTGGRFWIRALRLFEPNDWSTDDDDLWCDHASRSGFAVFMNNASTLEASYTHTDDALGLSLPLDLGHGLTLSAASVEAAYAHVEVEHEGGYFPLGANTIWHGGVHLHAALGSPVVACADGVVIAARLTAPLDEQGSRNFVLVRHGESAPEEWYSVYAHLEPLADDDPRLGELAWLEGSGPVAGGALAVPLTPVAPGEALGWVGSYGLEGERHDLIHFEVFSAEVLAGEGEVQVEDSDGDLTVDAAEVFDLVQQQVGWEDPDQVNLSSEEVRRFYAEDARAADLRGVACRFTSEWGVDLDLMIAGLTGAWDTTGLAELLAPYLWWDEVPAEHLPADRRVWHYHPIHFLARKAGVADAPPAECPPADEGPKVARGRMLGALFDTNRTLLLPEGVDLMRQLKQYYDRHPGGEVLLVGHADRSGDDAYNLQLSLERAEAIAAYLQDDADAWLAWYSDGSSKAWGRKEDQHMLGFLGDASGVFYAGPVDGSSAINDAVERFQSWSNQTRATSLAVDGLIGPNTRAELVAAYMAADETTLPSDTRVVSFGAGEYFPLVETADGVSEEQNRRVEVFLFPDGIEPPAPGPTATPDCWEYPEWLEAVEEEIEFGEGEYATLWLRDAAGNPIADLEVTVERPDGSESSHVSDAAGQVQIPGAAGDLFKVLRTSPSRVLRQV